MKKLQLQQKLAALNHQINEEISNTELPRSVAYRGFPVRNWGLALLCFAWWLVGGMLPYVAPYHPQTQTPAFIAGAVLALIALLRSILWLFRPRPVSNKAYAESTKRVRKLQEERRQIQQRIKEIEDGD